MLVIAVLFLLLVVVFALQNAQMVPLFFLGWSYEINQALVVLGAASLGIIIGVMWVWVKTLPYKGQIKELTKERDASKERISTLERALQDTVSRQGAALAEEDATP